MNPDLFLENRARHLFKSFDLLSLEIEDSKTRDTKDGQLEKRIFYHESFSKELINPQLTDLQKINDLKISDLTLGIRFQNTSLGHLKVTSTRHNYFTPSIRSALEDFASQMACFLKATDKKICSAVDSIVEEISILAPDRYDWTGVYLLSGGLLHLTAFRGEATPHMIIPVDSGICGAAVREQKTLNIPDVGADDRYISCSIKTKSEIVIPIFLKNQVIGEIDIDSHRVSAFDQRDEENLRLYAERISKLIID